MSTRRPWWATAFWTHGGQLLLAFLATVVIYVILTAMTLLLFSRAQTRALLEVQLPTMAVLLVGMIFLAPDRDRMRARALLGGDLQQVIGTYVNERTAAELDVESVQRAQAVILANVRVEREAPPAVLWILDFILLVAGAWLGDRFVKAFAPPPMSPGWTIAAQIFAILLPVAIAASIVLAVRNLAKQDAAFVARFVTISHRPDFYYFIPLHKERFRRKFEEDLEHAFALAAAPAESLAAAQHFVPAARVAMRWRPEHLLDLSYTMFQLGAGLILGAVFEVLQ
jgi:hypothetical protein